MASREETCEFEQLLYGWSESNIFGRRGFGVTGASDGWRPLLQGGSDVLGPVVAYPEPGRRGAHPPPHGGFAVLRGVPVVFRRMPSGTDALDRPGNYTVQVLIGRGFEVDAPLAAAMLMSGWLESALPPDGPSLPVLKLPKPGARRGAAEASAVVCAAVLQGLRDGRSLVIESPTEQEGRAAVCDALRRLPGGLGSALTFSTLESEPDRSGFDLALAVVGWEVAGRTGRGTLRIDVQHGGALDADCLRWGQALVDASAPSLKGIAEPVTVAAVGVRLDGLACLESDPQELSPEGLLSVLTCPPGQAWAALPEAPEIAARIMAGMEPSLGPKFAKAAQRRPVVSGLLSSAGWKALSDSGRTVSRGGAEAVLLGLGERQSDIDMAVLAALPGDVMSPQDSARFLRLLQQRRRSSAGLVDDPAAAKVQWDVGLMKAYPHLWFESVVGLDRYQGPRATSEVVAGLDPRVVGAALTRAAKGGGSEQGTAVRLWRVLPAERRATVAFLRLIAATDVGLPIVFHQMLAQRGIDPSVRAALLEAFWPILVREWGLPPYVAIAMRPVSGRGPRLSRRGRIAASLLTLAVIGSAISMGLTLAV